MTTMMHNAEFRKQAERAVRIISASSPYIHDEDCGSIRRSRRIPGMWTMSGERQGYRHVYCYIEKGLEDRLDPVASFLTFLMRFQQQHGYSDSRIFLASFGGEKDDIKHAPILLRVSSIGDAGKLAKALCMLSGAEKLEEGVPSVFKTFFPKIAINYTNVGAPTAEDIVVIFKSPAQMLMRKRTKNYYLNRLKKHSAVVTIGDGDDFSIETGRFIPEEWQEPEGAEENNDNKKILGLSYGL